MEPTHIESWNEHEASDVVYRKAATKLAEIRCDRKVNKIRDNGGAADYWPELFQSTRDNLIYRELIELQHLHAHGFKIIEDKHV